MLGSTPITAVLGSGVDPTDHAAVRSYIRSACDIGLNLLLIIPGTKRPFDGRSPKQRKDDDEAAQAQAKAEGRSDWENVKSASGLALATSDKTLMGKYLTAYIRAHGEDCAVSLAVEVGSSGLVIVDCDTEQQRYTFLEANAKANDTELIDVPPTVISPGTQDAEGNWIHEPGNGHYWFTVPDDWTPPTNTGAMTWGGSDGFAVLWDRRYVLIPPSRRKEGSYELLGHDYEVPTWLREAIDTHASAKKDRQSNATVDNELASSIDEWAEKHDWATILEPLGWSRFPRPDACGCDVWTAPGDHASPKSATAHDSGCTLGRYTETNAPLHIWTDHDIEPFTDAVDKNGNQIKTISKLQAVSMADYGSDIGKAMDGLGLSPKITTLSRELGVNARGIGSDIAPHNVGEDIELPSDDPADDEDDEDEENTPNPDIFETGITGVPVVAPFSHWRDMPPPEYVVDGLLEHGGLSCIIGPPGVGKSSVSLDMACHIATGRPWQGRKTLKTRVMYLPGEGLAGAVQRIKAWGYMHDMPDEVIDDGLRLGNAIIQLGASKEAWGALAEYIIRQQIGLVIFDTFARMALDVEENSATEMGKAVIRFDHIRRLTNAGVLIVHHTAKGNPSSGRGSSALMGALESELLVTEGMWDFEDLGMGDGDRFPDGKKLQLAITKQKNAEQADPMPLMMRSCDNFSAPYITGPNGEIDPLSGDVVLARPVEEPAMETALRIREFVAKLTEQGATRTDIVAAVRPDAFTSMRRDSTRAWKQKVAIAVDMGLRYGVLETASGQRLGSRYVSGPVSDEDARRALATDVLNDSGE